MVKLLKLNQIIAVQKTNLLLLFALFALNFCTKDKSTDQNEIGPLRPSKVLVFSEVDSLIKNNTFENEHFKKLSQFYYEKSKKFWDEKNLNEAEHWCIRSLTFYPEYKNYALYFEISKEEKSIEQMESCFELGMYLAEKKEEKSTLGIQMAKYEVNQKNYYRAKEILQKYVFPVQDSASVMVSDGFNFKEFQDEMTGNYEFKIKEHYNLLKQPIEFNHQQVMRFVYGTDFDPYASMISDTIKKMGFNPSDTLYFFPFGHVEVQDFKLYFMCRSDITHGAPTSYVQSEIYAVVVKNDFTVVDSKKIGYMNTAEAQYFTFKDGEFHCKKMSRTWKKPFDSSDFDNEVTESEIDKFVMKIDKNGKIEK